VHGAAAGVVAGGDAAQQQPSGGDRDGHFSQRGDEQHETGDHAPPRHGRGERRQAPERQQVVDQGEVHQPARPDQHEQRDAEQGLADPAAQRGGQHGARGRGHDGRSAVEFVGERTDARVVVDVGDARVGVAFPQCRDELRGRQRAAAAGEEVVVGAGGGHTENRRPGLRQPGRRGGEQGRVPAGVRQRPGQGRAVHFSGGAGGDRVDDGQQRNQCGGQFGAQTLGGGGAVEVGGSIREAEVADQHVVAGRGGLHDGGGPGDAREGLQRGIHFAQFDATPAEFDLVVGAAGEDQPGRFEAHQVAAAVGTVPAQRGERGVLFGVFFGVEVAGQADPADDEFPGFAFGDAGPGGVDHGEVPALQWQADAHRAGAAEQGGAGHDGRLGGAVGVPHFAPAGADARGQFGRAGFAAEDDQAHQFEGVVGPERGEGGHCRHDGHAMADQPGPQVGAGAHQGSGRRHEAGAVAPGQPHFLAGGVEGHRQAGEHPVAGAEGFGLQEQSGFGVDEGGGGTVRHGHALGNAGRTGGEDDPGVVVGAGDARRRREHGRVVEDHGRVGVGGQLTGLQRSGVDSIAQGEHPVVADDPHDAGFTEHQSGTFLGVIGVDGHVRSAHQYGRKNRRVQLAGT